MINNLQCSAYTSLREKIAQMLIVGFTGTDASNIDEIAISAVKNEVGGLIFYKRNIESKFQIQSLINYFKSKLDNKSLLFALDQEGGLVKRLSSNNGFNDYLSAKEISEKDISFIAKHYYDMSLDISSAGFNFVLAPVVDLDYGCQVISGLNRSFSNNPYKVAQISQIFIEEMNNSKIKTSLKHFPGHGSANGDTHLGLVDASKTWSKEELMPFKLLIDSKKVDSIMTSHIIVRDLDKVPATMSKNIIEKLLRNELGYDGVVISDDLAMHALTDNYNFKDIIISTINAGVDFLLFSNNQGKELNLSPGYIIELIEKAVRDDLISQERIEQSYYRIKDFLSSIEENKLFDVEANLCLNEGLILDYFK